MMILDALIAAGVTAKSDTVLTEEWERQVSRSLAYPTFNQLLRGTFNPELLAVQALGTALGNGLVTTVDNLATGNGAKNPSYQGSQQAKQGGRAAADNQQQQQQNPAKSLFTPTPSSAQAKKQ